MEKEKIAPLSQDILKKKAGLKAAALVRDGDLVGLGTGSTSSWATQELGRRVREEGLSIRCASSSSQTDLLAEKEGLILSSLGSLSYLDISIDGADEIDPNMNLIKGRGGAHSLEKLMHFMSNRFVIAADSSKKVDFLGQKNPVPIEILPDARSYAEKKLSSLEPKNIKLRIGEGKCGPLLTDNANWILDVTFDSIDDPERYEIEIQKITGVIENGIFAKIRPTPGDCIIF